MKRVEWRFVFSGILFGVITLLLCCQVSYCPAQDTSGFASSNSENQTQSPKPLVAANRNSNSNASENNSRASFSTSKSDEKNADSENSSQKKSFFSGLWGGSKKEKETTKSATDENAATPKPVPESRESKPAPKAVPEKKEAKPAEFEQEDLASTEDELDWELVHSDILPFEGYFIDTRIVGAVRYHADFPLDQEYEILRELKNIQKDLSQYLAIPKPRETIEVFFFNAEESYRKFLAVEFPDAPFDRRALFIKEKGPGMVLVVRNPEMNEDLRHEMTHAFLHSTIRYVPLWLDEGLAEYFEKPRETRATENPYFKTIARKIMFGSVPSLSGLEKLLYFDQMGAEEYCHAWSWVHFMIHHSRKTHETLAGYIRLLDEYGEKTPRIERYLLSTSPDLKKEYLDHFRNWKDHLSSKSRRVSSQTPPVKSGMDITRSYDQSVIR